MIFELSRKQFAYAANALMIASLGCFAGGCAAQVAATQTAVPAPPPLPQSSVSAAGQTPAAQVPVNPGQANPDQPNPDQSGEPGLVIRNQKALEGFEPAEHEEYTLGAGDEITLDFPGRPELSGRKTVGPDGRITLVDAGGVQVADLTRDQAGKAIWQALSKFYTDPQVTVSVDKYSSNRVRVIGYVQHPGEILFEDTPTLLDAIGRAGLISPTILLPNGQASNVGPGVPEMCTIYRGNSVAVQVQLRDLLVKGSALADMRLRRNDIVYVPEPQQLFVSVMGQVGKPGTIPLTKDSTLTSILAQAGCCSEVAGFNPRIHIISPSTGKDVIIEYKKILTISGQQEFAVHNGDVIFVPISGFNKFSSVVMKVTPMATMVSFAALLGAG